MKLLAVLLNTVRFLAISDKMYSLVSLIRTSVHLPFHAKLQSASHVAIYNTIIYRPSVSPVHIEDQKPKYSDLFSNDEIINPPNFVFLYSRLLAKWYS